MRPLITCFLAGLVFGSTLVSCTDVEKARHQARGEPHLVRIFSGGEVVGEWTTKGHTNQSSSSSVVEFRDAETGLLVRVRGTIIVEQIPKASQ